MIEFMLFIFLLAYLKDKGYTQTRIVVAVAEAIHIIYLFLENANIL